MSSEYCLKILEKHLHYNLWLFSILSIIVIIIIILSFTNRFKDKLSTERYGGFLLLIGLAILFCENVVPVMKDVKQADFVTTEVQYYYRYPNRGGTRHNFFKTSKVLILFPGESESQSLYLPAWAKDEAFPMGKYTGTITYAKRSKVILSVKTGEKIDE